MKKLSQEDDLTLLEELQPVYVPSLRELLYFIFMLILYYSNKARLFFWFLLVVSIVLIVDHFIESFRQRTRHRIIINELQRRKFIK